MDIAFILGAIALLFCLFVFTGLMYLRLGKLEQELRALQDERKAAAEITIANWWKEKARRY